MLFVNPTQYLHVIGGAMCSLLLCANAFADDCATINNNRQWNDGMTKLSSQMTNKQWDEAFKTAEALNAICDRSPQLNYAMGLIHKEKGDDTKALYYMQRATRFTEEFAVKGDTLEKMWAGRYEAEHPEARPSEIAKRQQELEESKKQIDALTKENIKLKGDVNSASLGSTLESFEDDEAERRHYAAGLWTGVAFTSVGIVLTGLGAGLGFKNDNTVGFDPVKDSNNDIIGVQLSANQENNIYWSLLGAGIGVTIAGAVISGIFGYYYTHPTQSSTVVSFYSTPNGIGIHF